MFDLVLNTPFICNANQLTSFYLIRIFTESFFYKQAIEIWISIIHAKKSTLIIIAKRNLELHNLDFLYYSAKAWPLTCSGLYRLIFQSLYHTSLILLKREIDETVNFQNFC